MNNFNNTKVWVTGAGSGLGLALVELLLEKGAHVAASGRSPPALSALQQQYPQRLLVLGSNLSEPGEAENMIEQITDRWNSLDYLIINAGTSDYLTLDMPPSAIIEGIISSNVNAATYCLSAAMPLLQRGNAPQVVGILSRHSALQLHNPGQLPGTNNSLIQFFNTQRAHLAFQSIDLTMIAPLNLKFPLVLEPVTPEPWTAKSAARVILESLPDRSANMVLEAVHLSELWPLPQ